MSAQIEISAPAGAKILLITSPKNHGMDWKHIEDMRRQVEHDLWMAVEKDQWPRVLILEEGISLRWLEAETPPSMASGIPENREP